MRKEHCWKIPLIVITAQTVLLSLQIDIAKIAKCSQGIIVILSVNMQAIFFILHYISTM